MKTTIPFILLCGICLFPALSNAQTGSIKGTVIDRETKEPLIGANVLIMNTQRGAATNKDGKFFIDHIPVGSYSVRIGYIGYETLIKTDVIVRSHRSSDLVIELAPTTLQSSEVSVTAGYFYDIKEQPVSAVNFSNEEIRRSPGSAGDISRVISGLPSVAQMDDQQNALVVRGGSPFENGFYVDNIRIPNINHFPVQGSTSGPIGILNVDLIRDVTFYAGGFSAEYGNDLSSVLNIQYREGNRDNYDGQLDLNFAGGGFIAEGPLNHGRGSWIVSSRRSYLDLLLRMMNVSVRPVYGDSQTKLVYDINKNNRISFLDILGYDNETVSKEAAKDLDVANYGHENHIENTSGFNWRRLWNDKGYSSTAVSHTISTYSRNYSEYLTNTPVLDKKSTEQALNLRNINHYRFSPYFETNFGIESGFIFDHYDYTYPEYTNALGHTTPAQSVNKHLQAAQVSGFASLTIKPANRFTTIIGVRGDYYSYTSGTLISPRFSVSYQLSEKTTLNGSAGLFTENLPMMLLSQQTNHKVMATPEAEHYIIGLDHLLTPSLRLTLEAYYKSYRHFPMDPNQPTLFIIDEPFYRDGFYYSHQNLIATGQAFSKGVEVMIQKKFANKFYGYISGTWFQSRYRDYNGIWRNRVFDNRFIFSTESGYKLNKKWEFSFKWTWAGGHPYTPFDLEASRNLQREVLDPNFTNTDRYPVYHSLNIRADRRFYFKRTNLITYLSLWNAYNRKNVARYYWNRTENNVSAQYQWSLMPIFGVEFEF